MTGPSDGSPDRWNPTGWSASWTTEDRRIAARGWGRGQGGGVAKARRRPCRCRRNAGKSRQSSLSRSRAYRPKSWNCMP